jgi:tyrosyl-tRNA synthetase
MKKAFCEPGNTDFCPPISLASTFAFDIGGSLGQITVKRCDDNGGDITFACQDELVASFSDGSLHPGDLKAASSTIIVEILDKISGALKADGDAAKAVKGLKALQKKLAKKKK